MGFERRFRGFWGPFGCPARYDIRTPKITAYAKVDGSPQMPDNPRLYPGGPMEPITATFSVTEEPDSVAPVAPREAFLAVAVGLVRGAMVLAAAPPSESAWALALVSGHILECSLKAFLSKAGLTEPELKEVGHNLSELWARAVRKGLPISATPPDWTETLNRLHDKPYILRYPMGLHAHESPHFKNGLISALFGPST